MHFSVSLTQNLVVLLFAGAENECDTCESFSNENGDGAGQLCFGLFGDSGLSGVQDMVSTVVGVDIVEHLAAFSSEVSIEFRSLEVRIVLLHVEAVGLDVTILGVEVEGLGSAPGKDRKIEDRKFALDAVNVDPLGREDLFTIEDDLLEVGLVEGQTGIGFAIFDEQLCRSGQLPGTAGQVVVDVELTVREVDVNGLDFGAELVGLGFGTTTS